MLVTRTIVLLCVFAAAEYSGPVRGIDTETKYGQLRKYLKRFKKKEGAVFLTSGKNQYEGNVEIFHNGVWGSICDDEWDVKDAMVVCRQLGFKSVRKVTHGSFFGKASDRFWMDNLYCQGIETRLSDCHFEGWGLNDCDATEAAGVVCDPSLNSSTTTQTSLPKPRRTIRELVKSDLQVRLNGGRTPEEGRVEVKYNDSDWGLICGDNWGLLEASVVCRSLGLGYAQNAAQTNFFGGNFSNIVLSGVTCRGMEHDLDTCTSAATEPNDCPSIRSDQIAGVVCTDVLPDLAIDVIEIERSGYIEDRQLFYLQCAMEENCLASSAYHIRRDRKTNWQMHTRRLFRFTAKITNVGSTEFRPFVPKHMWEFHQCHMHYHSMEVFATFDILDQGGLKVAEGHKASFCLEDNQCIDGAEPIYSCAKFGDQGISVNCSDIYRHTMDCQWVDITELNPGLYTIQITVNPEFKVPEMTFSNNRATCMMFYAETFINIHNCYLEHP